MKALSRTSFYVLALLASTFTLLACSSSEPSSPKTDTPLITLDVYKSPSCGCCSLWVDHLNEKSIATVTHDLPDLDHIKQKAQIPKEMRSCHTAISKEGYFFEGHIPAHHIHRFLSSPPQGAIGLAVPGMPMGSPGMEMGNRFDPYDVVLINKDGSRGVFASVTRQKDQYQ